MNNDVIDVKAREPGPWIKRMPDWAKSWPAQVVLAALAVTCLWKLFA